MSIHAENHAAPADACQLNGIQGTKSEKKPAVVRPTSLVRREVSL
ncbi:hypothetical protein [Acetobacter cerevisiae]|nr:hypothetical protein [Acetobacter cerevisiae]